MKNLIILFLAIFFLSSCSQTLVPNLSEYKSICTNTKYLVSNENEKGFELSLFFETDDFYTEKRRLMAESRIAFKDVAKLLCIRKDAALGKIDENNFIYNADISKKCIQIVNWVKYEDKQFN